MMKKPFSRRSLLRQSLATGAGLFATHQTLNQSAFGQAIYNPDLTQLTQFHRGDLPILIVAPHGGTELVYGIASRRNINRPVSNFSYYSAVWTREICTQISRTIERLSGGKKPSMVLNLAHRRYVDVNREESDAYEVILNAPRIYWEYHDFVNEYVNRMNVLYENPIMIEISGQRELPNLIVRRTLNGKSVDRLVSNVGEKEYKRKLQFYNNTYEKLKNTKQAPWLRATIKEYEEKKADKIFEYGNVSYAGENSVIGEIKKRGYPINPDLYETATEQALSVAGNYTLQRYGLRDVSNINVIQLVIGSDFRRTSNYKQTGHDLGNAIWAFAEKYILEN
ncbi:MAG: hypothetical protein ACJARD_001023 [Alphaproteobacteria bacterium]|jgi:hypothetical protein